MTPFNLVWAVPLLLIAVLELLAIFDRKVPWVTLSAVAWYVERRWPIVGALLFGAGLALLWTHINLRVP